MRLIPAVLVLGLALGGCDGSTESQGGSTTGAGGSGGASVIGGAGGSAGVVGNVGDACTSTTECPAGGSGAPECLAGWPGGYCAVTGCADHGHDCPGDPGQNGTSTTGGKCVLDPAPTCLALCATSTDCREGYVCESRGDAAGHGEALVCVPAGGSSSSGSGGGMSSSSGMGGGSGGGMSSSSSGMGGGMGM